MKQDRRCLKAKTWTKTGHLDLPELSEYEIIRKNNIKEKEEMLRSIGILEAKQDFMEGMKRKIHKVKVIPEQSPAVPSRRSGRQEGKCDVKYVSVIKRYLCKEPGCKNQFDHRTPLRDHMRLKHWQETIPCLIRGCSVMSDSLASRRRHLKEGNHVLLSPDQIVASVLV